MFAATTFDKKQNVAAVFEWAVALIFTFYVITFFVDLLPAVRSKQARTNEEVLHMGEAENRTGGMGSMGAANGNGNGVEYKPPGATAAYF